jgi:hypothetical protein
VVVCWKEAWKGSYSAGKKFWARVRYFTALSRITYERSVVPLVVVLTKVDLLDVQLEIELPENETLEHYKSRWLNEHCIGPLCEAAGSDIPHVIVSGMSDRCRGPLMNGF